MEMYVTNHNISCFIPEQIQTGIQAAIMDIPSVDLVRGSDVATGSIGDFSSFDYLLNAENESMMGEARFITE